jgi:hypothetical protein
MFISVISNTKFVQVTHYSVMFLRYDIYNIYILVLHVSIP